MNVACFVDQYTSLMPPGADAYWAWICCRNRVQKRLCCLQKLLASLGWDKQRVTEEVAVPKLLAQDKMGMRPGIDPALVRAETDTTTLVPLEYNAVNFFRTNPVEVSSFPGYEDLEVADLEVPYEFSVLGYEREEHFGYDEYVPEMKHLRLETGAIDEDIQLHPCAQVSDFMPSNLEPRWFGEMPEAALQGTVAVEDIGNKWSPNQCGVVTAPYPVWGMRDSYLSSPIMLAKHSCADREEVASGTLRATTGLPMLSERWCSQLQEHKIGSRCQQNEYAILEGPDKADIEAACTSQLVRSSLQFLCVGIPDCAKCSAAASRHMNCMMSLQWEDGVADVPVQGPTAEKISEWLPEHMQVTSRKAPGDGELQPHKSDFFNGRQVWIFHARWFWSQNMFEHPGGCMTLSAPHCRKHTVLHKLRYIVA